MRRFVVSLICAVFALSLVMSLATPAEAQAAKPPSSGKVIDRYKKASGGGALKRIKSTTVSGTLKSAEGGAGSFLYHAASPDRLRIDITANGVTSSEAYNGKSAWRMDERGLRTLLGDEARRLRLESLLANTRLNDLSSNRIYAGAPVKSSVDGRDAWAVEFVKDEVRARLFFDAASGLIIKQERDTSEGVVQVFYGDHRPVDKVMEPFSIRIKRGESESLVSVDKVEHNRAPDEAQFRYPQAGGASLADVEPLMKAVVANQEKIEELRELYTFRESLTEREMDKGRVKKSETRDYDVTPVAGRLIRRLVSVDGKALSEREMEKEDRRVQKEVEELLKDRQKQKERAARQRESGKREEKDEDDITILSFLRISSITSVRRETLRGHQVMAFDFEPRKGFKPKNRGESLISKLAGTIWVDEQARQIVRLEARLVDSFKIGGGLVGSVSPSTAIAFEQEKVGDEVWLPSYSEANISARFFLFAKFNRNVIARYSDYKKHHVDSQYELAKPKEP